MVVTSAFEPPRLRRDAFATVVREALSTRDAGRWPPAPPGRGRPAMLVPGFLAGDPSLARMARWLRGGEWRTVRSEIRLNIDCMEPAVEALERRLEATVERAGRRALVVGQSRGGTFGWVLAVRRPDLVETLVTLGSPILDQMAASLPTRLTTYGLAAMGTLGVPGVVRVSCLGGSCCERSRGELTQPMPREVRALAFYSREDTVVSWQACVPPGAQHIEVPGTHVGMGMNREVWQRMAEALDGGVRR